MAKWVKYWDILQVRWADLLQRRLLLLLVISQFWQHSNFSAQAALHISDHFRNCQTPREPKCFCLNVVLTKSCRTSQTSSVVASDRFSVVRVDIKVTPEKRRGPSVCVYRVLTGHSTCCGLQSGHPTFLFAVKTVLFSRKFQEIIFTTLMEAASRNWCYLAMNSVCERCRWTQT